MRTLKIIRIILLFLLLTVFTQVGGIVYLGARYLYRYTEKYPKNNFLKYTLRICTFLTLYCIVSFLLVPIIAKPLGRVRLPLTETNHLQPLNVMTYFLNRNYVRPEMREAAFEAAIKMNDKFPGTTLSYLDANLPFINKFPLLPHLSHNDGRKLDLSFCYTESHSGRSTNKCPSLIGYGICEEALPGEKNTADFCADNGYWQYSILKRIVPQSSKRDFTFDAVRTKEIVQIFAANPHISKIFIEPHLKTRMDLSSPKIRFHGCGAVRHDDHIHIEQN